MKEKGKGKLDFMKIKMFYSVKYMVKKIKGRPQNERRYLKNISDKGLVPRIYRWLLKLNSKITSQLKKMGKDVNRHLTKEEIQMANKHRQ